MIINVAKACIGQSVQKKAIHETDHLLLQWIKLKDKLLIELSMTLVSSHSIIWILNEVIKYIYK